MQIEIGTVKGFQDFMPPESQRRAAIKKIIEKYYQLYGFLPLETPVVEFDELMKSDVLAGEDEAVSDRFRLKDRAGRNLGLRYEFTFQLSRVFKMNPNIKLPFRRYQLGPIFRDEPTGPGRFRQFTQCDADILGDTSAACEAELLAMVSDILKDLKIDAQINVNNRKLLAEVIESVEIKNAKDVMRELDKRSKIGEDMVKLNLKKYADSNQVLTLFKMLEKGLDFFKDNAFDGAKEIVELEARCKKYGVKIVFNPFMIRGLGYYTGNIFEVISTKDQGTIAGGGRYDKVVGKFIGRDIPAVGISFGLERVSALANITPESTKAIIISIGQEAKSVALAKAMRKNNVSCILYFDKIGKALELANSYGIPFAVFIGDDEVKAGKYKLRNMVTGNEQLLPEKQILSELGISQQ